MIYIILLLCINFKWKYVQITGKIDEINITHKSCNNHDSPHFLSNAYIIGNSPPLLNIIFPFERVLPLRSEVNSSIDPKTYITDLK